MFYIIVVSWVVVDLVSKYLAWIYLRESVKIFWDLVFLKYIENTWIAFSLPLEWILLKIVTISLIFGIFYYYFKEERKNNKKIVDISFGLILAWAIWNGIERIFYWKVIDFFWIQYFSVFNLADSFITIWAIIYLYSLYNNK